MRSLLIDNHDAYTFDLFHLLGGVNGEEPLVVHNDAVPWDELDGWDVDTVVISPGPGRPQHPRDVGVSMAALARACVPVLGVCLGHQALARDGVGALDDVRANVPAGSMTGAPKLRTLEGACAPLAAAR